MNRLVVIAHLFTDEPGGKSQSMDSGACGIQRKRLWHHFLGRGIPFLGTGKRSYQLFRDVEGLMEVHVNNTGLNAN